jgi:hypothetical protein
MQSHLGLPLEDLALDCISGLFERNARGEFCALQKYFNDIHWESLDEPALTGATRRLVFSQVNQELYRTYKESDPTLHRIIRNLKDAADALPGVSIKECNGENWIVFTNGAMESSRPVAPPEYIGPYLTAQIARDDNTRALLTEIRDILVAQTEYRSGFPVVRLALILREAFAVLADADADENTAQPAPDATLMSDDLATLLKISVRMTCDSFHSSYVEQGKISRPLFDAYGTIAQEVLKMEFLDDGGASLPYFERLRHHLPELSREEYMQVHRGVLEYLVKTARRDFLATVRRHGL